MPDFGLNKALSRAAREAAARAVVKRPGQVAAEEAATAAANATVPPAPVAAPVAPPVVDAAAAELQAVAPAAPVAKVRGRGPKKPAPTAPETQVAVEPVQPAPLEAVPPAQPQGPVVDAVSESLQQQQSLDAAATSIDEAVLSDFNLSKVHHVNFDTIKTTDDIKAVIAQVSESNKGQIDEARRGVITNEELSNLASELDLSSEVVAKVLLRESGGALNAETILAARQVLTSSAARLKSLAAKMNVGEATALERVQFARQLQFHNEYQTKFMGARAEAGRALNAFGILVGADLEVASRIDEIISAAGGNLDQMAKAIALAPNVQGVTRIAKAGLLRRGVRGVFNLINRTFVNGILSGPASHITNATGAVLYQAMNAAELAGAARLGRFLSGAEHVEVGEATAHLHGTLQATKDAFRLAALTAKTGKTLDDLVGHERVASTSDTLAQLPELDLPYLGRAIRVMDAVIDFPTNRVMGATDEFFKTLAYRGYLEKEAYLHLRNQVDAGAVRSADDARRVVEDFMQNTPQSIQIEAEKWARDMAFQTPLGPTGQKAQAFLRSVPALTLIAPFIRTPVNIFKGGIARSPLAVFSAKFWTDVNAGGRARDLALTRFAMGSATAALVAQWAIDDMITGSGPTDPAARQIWEATGRRPYSVRIGDQWHSYARLEPIASVLGIVADTVAITAYLNADTPKDELSTEEQQQNQIAGAVIAGVMNNTGNKVFMKGIADFVELLSDPKRNWNTYQNQMGSALIPYSAALRYVRNVQDPLLREAWTLRDKAIDMTPWGSRSLPPRRGLFGETREKATGAILGVMSPMTDSDVANDPVYAELARVMNATKIVPLTMPGKDVDGMRLNAAEYEHLVRLARQEPVFDGVTLKEALDGLMQDSEYQNMQPQMQAEIIKLYQNNADKIGRARLEEENLNYALRISTFRDKRGQLRTGM
jgi:hypothetical protein